MTEPTRPEPRPLSVRPDGPPVPTFLLGARDRRIGGALGASLASHLGVTGLVLLLISLAPEPVYQAFVPDRTSYNIVWLPQEGPGGGGGGGGNESLELPAQVEVQGEEQAKLSVPVEEPPDFVEPEPEPEEPALTAETLRIPAVPVAASLERQRGVLEGLMAQGPTSSQGSGRGGGAGAGDGTGIGPGRGSGLGPGEGGGVGGGAYRPGSGIMIPRPIDEVKPRYTPEAMRAKVQGAVWLECVVLPDGSVGDVKITKSLDPVFGLDQEAVRAAKQWKFIPGTRYGEPVAVLVTIELTFTLR